MLEKPHLFYQWSVKKQLAFVGTIVLFLVVIFAMSLYGSIAHQQFWTGIFIPLIVLTLAPFVDLPLGVKNGKFSYYAPLFILEKRKDQLVMHGGTLFDYFFVFNWSDRGRAAQNKSMHSLLKGCIALADAYQGQAVTFTGTSYFFNEKTAQRMGFTVQPPPYNERFILYLNYIGITAMHSFVNNRLSFPNMSTILSVQITAEQLNANKDQMIRMCDALEARMERTSTLRKSLSH